MTDTVGGEPPLALSDPRKRIIAAGLICVRRLGIRKTTMEDIASQAGMSRPSIYRHFGDRDELFVALVATQSHALVQRAHAYIDRQPTFGDRLVEGLLYLAEHGCRDPLTRHVHLENSELALRVVSAGVVEDLTEAFWHPFVDAATAAHLMPETLDRTSVYGWLGYVGLMLMRLLDENDSGRDRYRAMLRQFVVPVLLPGIDMAEVASRAATTPRET